MPNSVTDFSFSQGGCCPIFDLALEVNQKVCTTVYTGLIFRVKEPSSSLLYHKMKMRTHNKVMAGCGWCLFLPLCSWELCNWFVCLLFLSPLVMPAAPHFQPTSHCSEQPQNLCNAKKKRKKERQTGSSVNQCVSTICDTQLFCL